MRSTVLGVLMLASCSSSEGRTHAAIQPRGAQDSGVIAKPDAAVKFARVWADPLAQQPRGPEQTARVCARAGNDTVRDAFCGPEPFPITSLPDLRDALRMDGARTGRGADQSTVIDSLAVVAHSTSLSARSVSAINPQVISARMAIPSSKGLTPQITSTTAIDVLALSFTRGEQFAEIANLDRDDRTLHFYVVGFKQACNEALEGCKPGDLLTPAAEAGWLDATLYDDQDFLNTQMDCLPCHQPDGPETPRLLRMIELSEPWTHWFAQSSTGGQALIDDYVAAKGDEPLAGVAAAKITDARPSDLEQLTRFANVRPQPYEFRSDMIEDEVESSSNAQPVDNTIPGVSATWGELFERARAGAAVTVPYHDVKVTDPKKLERASAAYREFRDGQISRDELPDIRDVFPDDEQRLAEMGMMTTPGADGAAVLMEACSLCHNARLDQNLTRARFQADLVGVGRAERDEAVRRLLLPPDSPQAMPPPRLRVLSAEATSRAIEALQRTD